MTRLLEGKSPASRLYGFELRIHARSLFESQNPAKFSEFLRKTNPFSILMRDPKRQKDNGVALVRAYTGQQCYIAPRSCRSFQALEGEVYANNYHYALQKVAGVYVGNVDYLSLFAKKDTSANGCRSYRVFWKVEWNEGVVFTNAPEVLQSDNNVYMEFAKHMMRKISSR